MHLEKSFLDSLIEITTPLLSGALIALSFIASDSLWWVSSIAFVPLFFFLKGTKTRGGAFFGAWIAGFLAFGGSFFWYWNTLPLDWLGVPTFGKGILYVGISWGLTTLLLSFPAAVWGVIVRQVLQSGTALGVMVYAPLLWVGVEYIRAWLYALLTYGAGVAWGPYFTPGFVGYLLAHHPILLQLASIGRVYALSFVVLSCNGIIWHLLAHTNVHPMRRALLSLCFLLLLIGTASIQIPERTGGTLITVAALHTDFPPTLSLSPQEKAAHTALYQTLAGIAAQSHPEVVIFPEDTRFLSALMKEGRMDSFISTTFGDARPFLVDSGATTDADRVAHQELWYYDTNAKALTVHDKVFLAPQGEYVPKLFSFIVSLFGDSTSLIERYRTFYPRGAETVGERNGLVIGGLFCSEMFSPDLYRTLRHEGATLLVNVASHAWFHGSRMLFNQFKEAAQVRAVENRLPLVVAANVSPSFVVDAWGRIRIETGWGGPSVLIARISL